jgi:Tol biopolymer transport system component
VDRAQQDLVVIDASTGEQRLRTPVRNRADGPAPLALLVLGGPSWSPDGARLAFVCWDGTGDEICVVDVDGTRRRQVTRIAAREGANTADAQDFLPAAANVGPPAWSPDGMSLAVAAYPEKRGAASGVFVVDLERGAARRISSLLPTSDISWYPDGTALLFSADEKGRSDAIRAKVSNASATKLTASMPEGARDPALSADGQHVAVSSGGNIIVLDLDGDMRSLNELGLRGRYPAWSADGDSIAFAASPDPIAVYE